MNDYNEVIYYSDINNNRKNVRHLSDLFRTIDTLLKILIMVRKCSLYLEVT